MIRFIYLEILDVKMITTKRTQIFCVLACRSGWIKISIRH